MSSRATARPGRPGGVALALVLLTTVVVLGVLLTGLSMASQHALNVATTHRRHLARGAAEGAVYLALQRLEVDPDFRGSLDGTLKHSGAPYQAQVDLGETPGHLVIRAEGRDRPGGSYVRRLEVTVTASSESYNALTTEGYIRVSGNSFINAVRSLLAPTPVRGYAHSNITAPNAIYGSGKLTVTGQASAVGTVGEVVEAEHRKDGAETRRPRKLTREEVLSGAFTEGPIPASGAISGNTRVTRSAIHRGDLALADGATLHVQGHLIVEGGITGKGKVVTDGNLELRGASELDLSNTEGVLLYSEGDLVIADPDAVRTSGTGDDPGAYSATGDPVRDYFASMPPNAVEALGENLPLGAPTGEDFFVWYATQSADPSPEFLRWRDGASSTMSGLGGLPQDVRSWLDASIPIAYDIVERATTP